MKDEYIILIFFIFIFVDDWVDKLASAIRGRNE